tara:strand:- start:5274 stop:5603 length:330 start_codon:yes stop_codon:yes gene_type:complete
MTNYKAVQKAIVWYSEYLKDKDKKKHGKWGWRLDSVVAEVDEAGLQASAAVRGNTDTYSVALMEERGKVRWSCAGHVGKQKTLCSHILFFVLVLVSKRKLKRKFLEQLL